MAAPDWTKLVVPLDEIDAPRALAPWQWLVDRSVEPLELTRFGDWFLGTEDRAIWRLDILEGTFEPVCASVDEFEVRKGDPDVRDDWYLEGIVEALHRSGMRPGRGQGFGYNAPPILGASLERDNIAIVELVSWQFFSAGLHRALSQLAPGTPIHSLEVLPDGTLKVHTS